MKLLLANLILALWIPCISGFIPIILHHRTSRPSPIKASGDDTTDDTTQPTIVSIIGHPGSGQSTFARMIADEYSIRLMSVAEEGILEELRDRIREGKGKVSMPQAMTDAVIDRIRAASKKGDRLVLDGWPRGPYQLDRLREEGGDIDTCMYLDTGEESEDPQLVGLVEMLGDKASRVINEGSVDKVFQEIRGIVDPILGEGGKSTSRKAAVPMEKAPAAKVEEGSKKEDKQGKEGGQTEKPILFGGLILTNKIANALRKKGIVKATEVQEVAMPKIKRGENVLIHEETGSGKTLAYLLPLLQDLDPSIPRQVFVVTPTRELAVQVAGVVADLQGGNIGERSGFALYVEETKEETLSNLQTPVIVGSAKVIFNEMVKTNTTLASTEGGLKNLLGDMKALVIDEVDRCIAPLGAYATLKDKMKKFRHPKPATSLVEEIYLRLGLSPQIIGASATIGRPLRRELARCMGVDPKFKGPSVIRGERAIALIEEGGRAVSVPKGIEHRYIVVPGDDLQHKLMAARGYLIERQPKAPLIFVPSDIPVSEVVARLSRLLRGTGIDVMALHEALGFNRGRGDELGSLDLLSRHFEVSKAFEVTKEKKRQDKQNSPVLVTSVDTARGLDFGAAVDCVLILGRANSPDEYQHVAGRTGRRGAAGVAISILSYVDIKKLNSWEAMLGIRFRKDEANKLIL